MNLTKKNTILYALVVIISFLLESYIVLVEQFKLIYKFSLSGFATYFSVKHFLIFLVLFSIIYYIFIDEERKSRFLNLLDTYKIPILALFVLVCVAFQLHGSSINELNTFFVKHNTLFGVSRPIRTDEFNVNTMLAFSQYMNNFSYFSDIVRAAPTDMFLIYGQPVWDIAMIFKPFLIGYLFLPQGYGLSFFWVSRLVVLLLVSYEFGRLITDKNRTLALAYALLITFSPLIQWWFAINGLVEMLIFGQLAVLLIHYYMTCDDYKKRLIIALGLMICVGGFALTMYPSWQIPFAYVFVLLACWIFLKHRKTFSVNKKDLAIFAFVIALFAVLMAHVLSNSLETIKILMNTAYPGKEVFNGMGDLTYFFNYVPSIFFSLMPDGIPLNVVDTSAFCDFFPVPIILTFIVLFYQKTKDKLLLGLLAIYAILIVLYIVPVPDFILDITLRGHVRNIRLYSVIGFVGCLMLIRSICDLKEFADKRIIIGISVALSFVVVYLSRYAYRGYYAKWMLVILVLFYAIYFAIIFLSSTDKGKRIFLIACIVMCFFTGALVNPVDTGVEVVYDSPYMQEVSKIVESDPDANWIVQDMYLNALIPLGAKTINSINTYPDLEKWHTFDVNNASENVYNRYAHICFILQDDAPTSFALASVDIIHIYFNVNDLQKLNVSYIASPNNLTELSNENVTFENIYQQNEFKIYHVTYH